MRQNTKPPAPGEGQAFRQMQRAVHSISIGAWDQAADELKRAAELHKQATYFYDEARCLQMAATLKRLAGSPDKAKEWLNRAEKIAINSLPLSIAILCEKAEELFAAKSFEDALIVWAQACALAKEIPLSDKEFSTLLRRQAEAFLRAGRYRESCRSFDEASEKLVHTGLALWVRIEQALLFYECGYKQEAHALINEVENTRGKSFPDMHLTAEICCFRARYALDENEVRRAIGFSLQAREAALQAITPLSYYKAATLLARAYELENKRVQAYGVLAAAWVTLGDLLGMETARSWVEPCLLGFHALWGKDEFGKVKARYEEERKGRG